MRFLSTNRYYSCKGHLIEIATGVIVVPFQADSKGWYVVVVASNHPAYPLGAYNLYLSHGELRGGRRIDAAGLLGL